MKELREISPVKALQGCSKDLSQALGLMTDMVRWGVENVCTTLAATGRGHAVKAVATSCSCTTHVVHHHHYERRKGCRVNGDSMSQPSESCIS